MVRPLRVLAIGWFGEGNLGDEAMLEGLLTDLRRTFGAVEATVMSADPGSTERVFGVRAIPLPTPDRSGYRNPAMIRAFLRADLVTLGGGDLIRETRGALAPARFWLRRLRIARGLRRPTVAIGISVSELRDPGVSAETADRMGRLSLVAVRDRESADRLVALGLARPHVIGDLALDATGLDTASAPASPARARASGPRGLKGARIGVVTRELVGRGPDLEREAGPRLTAALAAALDEAVAAGATIELVPFRTRSRPGLRDDDAAAGEALAGAAVRAADWRRHSAPLTAAAFAEVAAGLDLVLSVRLHGLVLGAAAGTRVLGLAYDPKVTGFLGDLGVPEQALPIGADGGTIRAAIERSLAADDLSDRLARGVADARARTAAFLPELAGLVGRERPTAPDPSAR